MELLDGRWFAALVKWRAWSMHRFSFGTRAKPLDKQRWIIFLAFSKAIELIVVVIMAYSNALCSADGLWMSWTMLPSLRVYCFLVRTFPCSMLVSSTTTARLINSKWKQNQTETSSPEIYLVAASICLSLLFLSLCFCLFSLSVSLVVFFSHKNWILSVNVKYRWML